MKFFNRKKKTILCFNILNFKEVEEKDINALSNLENEFALAGALPERIDSPQGIFCIRKEREELSIEEIIAVFKKFGYNAVPKL